MRTKFILLAFSLITLFALEACKSLKKENDVIKIGAILPLTGPAASAGIDSRDGLILAVDQWNYLSTKGNRYKLLIEDSKAQAKDGVNALNKLNLFEKPEVIYSQLSNVSLAIKPITERTGQILFAVSGSNNLIDSSSSKTYRNYINPKYYATLSAQIIKDSLGINKIGIFYSNNDFGISIKDNIYYELKNNNISVQFIESYDERADDFRTLILKNINKESDLMNFYVIGIGKSLGVLIKQIKEQNISYRIIGGIELPYPDVTNIIGNNLDDIYYIDFGFDPIKPKPYSEEFIKSFKTKFNRIPTTSSAIAYDAINLYKLAINKNSTRDINLNDLQFPYHGVSGMVYVRNNEIFYELSLKKISNEQKRN